MAAQTYTQVAKEFGITVEQAKQLSRVMQTTWNYVGSDFLASYPSEKAALADFDGNSAHLVAEAVLDANRYKVHARYDNEDVSWIDSLSDYPPRSVLELGIAVQSVRRIF